MRKAILLTIIAAIALIGASMVSAVMPNQAPYANGLGYGYGSYGSHPVNPSHYGISYPYATQPARIGGWFGQNSAFLVGLKPGFYDGPSWNARTRQQLASAYYPRAGGYFGHGNYGYNLRPGSFSYSGGAYGSAPSYYFHGPV